jgi:hypothetical protein
MVRMAIPRFFLWTSDFVVDNATKVNEGRCGKKKAQGGRA